MTKYYFDTYALIGAGKASSAYSAYLRGATVLTNKLNIMELAFFLVRERHGSEVAAMFSHLTKYHCEASDKAFIEAAVLKFKYKDRRLSYIDCLGYEIAKENDAKFLTGDEKFEDLPNVEFVK